jgi:hypothetical protein
MMMIEEEEVMVEKKDNSCRNKEKNDNKEIKDDNYGDETKIVVKIIK